MTGMRIMALACAVALALPAPVAAKPAPAQKEDTQIRVLLLADIKTVRIGAGSYIFKDLNSGASHKETFSHDKTIRITIGGILLDDDVLVKKISITPQKESDFIPVNGKVYRGRILLIQREPEKVQVFNELGLDDYVRGVLGVETAQGWSLEALKVQAIASRTFALRNLSRHAADGYDVCAQTHCQVYGGKNSEYALTNQASDATAGLVMLYRGAPVNAYFHACCGGSTEDAEGVWEGPGQPYLKAIGCRWCIPCPRFTWRTIVPDSDIQAKLAAGGYRIGRLKRIQILKREKSGRVSQLRIIGNKGKATLRGNAFRLLVGPDKVRSTLWSVMSHKGDSWLFIGNGWGHGVGMCQWGSKFMADKGKSAQHILRYYYRGITIEKWKG
jgi:stage II sporulation protein D